MITLQENQTNTIAYQKETDTPLVTASLEDGYVYNIVLIPTLQNDTSKASITYTTSSHDELGYGSNPRWETLSFNISSSSEYDGKQVKGLPGTTYNLEVWYGPQVTGSALVWGTTTSTWATTEEIWSFGGISSDVTYPDVTTGEYTLKYSDRVFISGSVSPIEKKYISSNENAKYIVYQG